MDLRQLRYFPAVLQLGLFSRAAEPLHVAQSAVTRQLQALEEEINVKRPWPFHAEADSKRDNYTSWQADAVAVGVVAAG